MPELEEHLHYRSIDVSTLKELCRRWSPEVYRKRPGKQETHRALLDVTDSIAELAFYRDAFLASPRSEARFPQGGVPVAARRSVERACERGAEKGCCRRSDRHAVRRCRAGR